MQTEQPGPGIPAPGRPSTAWALVAAVLGVAVIASFTLLAVFRSIRSVPSEIAKQGQEALREVRRIAEAFRKGTVTLSFRSYATQVTGTSYFQFATLNQQELFERKDEASLLWGQLALPDVIVEARAPVEYTYYLDFAKTWTFRLEGATVDVTAPQIEFNAPSIDASAIRFEVRAGSIFRSEAAALESLRLGLTEMAKRRALENIPLVREVGRRKTGEFVETWLRRSFEDAASHHVRVRFADERPAASPSDSPRR